MALIINSTEIDKVICNNIELEKIVYNGVTVLEALIAGYSSANTYINTGAGHTGGETKEWTRDIGFEVKPTSVSFGSNNNRGVTCYWKFYGSNNNSTWELLATAQTQGYTTTATINSNKFYRYYKVSQKNANWRRDDGNMVFSIEPWRIDYLKRK